MYISDIGQFNIEEINLGIAGANYGWRHREGTFAIYYDNDVSVVPLPTDDSKWNFTYPLLQYDHDDGQAIAGGFVYRGKLIPELYGYYVFSDLVNGRIFYVDIKNISSGKAGVMKELSPQIKGRFDGKRATELVKEIIG